MVGRSFTHFASDTTPPLLLHHLKKPVGHLLQGGQDGRRVGASWKIIRSRSISHRVIVQRRAFDGQHTRLQFRLHFRQIDRLQSGRNCPFHTGAFVLSVCTHGPARSPPPSWGRPFSLSLSLCVYTKPLHTKPVDTHTHTINFKSGMKLPCQCC